MLEGIDVSHYQGKIRWVEVAQAKQFGFIKFTEGLSTDPLCYQNASGATIAKLPWGGYVFVRPDQDPILQANHLVACQGQAPLPSLIDLETCLVNGQDQWALLSMDARIDLALRLTQRVQDCLKTLPFIYTDLSFWVTMMGDTDAFSQYPLIIAHYGHGVPALPKAWKQFAIHQYSEDGTCPGVDGHVDLDQFTGDLDDILKLGRV